MQLKLLQKESFKKPQNQLLIWSIIKLLIKSQMSQKFQKQWQISMIKKYLKKDISLKERQRIADTLREIIIVQ